MRIIQTILLCLFFNVSFSQESTQEKHKIVLNISLDSLGNTFSTYVPDSSYIKGLTQSTIYKMIVIAQRKARTMQLPAMKHGFNLFVKFEFTTVGGGQTKEQ